MTRGVLLFAFNSPDYNYFKMAEFTAKRINHFLNLPVTLVTDKTSLESNTGYNFDKIITVDSDSSNNFQGRVWLNKGRYRCFELTPYDETLLLDVDYVVNSDRLLQTFNLMTDFCCHQHISYLMDEHNKTEKFNNELSISTLWATVVTFKKTNRTKQIFECLKMIQENYSHYGNIHRFAVDTYRNDYGLTLAWNIVNGHSYVKSDIIPWNLIHIGPKTYVYKNSNYTYNTQYTIIYDKWMKGKIKKEYIIIKDMDFHIINKDIFLEVSDE